MEYFISRIISFIGQLVFCQISFEDMVGARERVSDSFYQARFCNDLYSSSATPSCFLK